MKNLRYFLLLSTAIASMLGLVGCKKTTSEALPQPIVLTAAAQEPDLAIFLAAADKTNLLQDLYGKGPLTVFAPQDSAFLRYLRKPSVAEAVGYIRNLDAPGTAALANILLYHAATSKLLAADLPENGVLPTERTNEQNGSLFVRRSSFGTYANTAKVIKPDLSAGSAVLHKIDQVLVEPTTTIAFYYRVGFLPPPPPPNLTIYTAVVSKCGYNAPQVGPTLIDKGPYTAFAPTDTAFAAYLGYTKDNAGISSAANFIKSLSAGQVNSFLKPLLLAHILAGKVYFSADMPNDSLECLNHNLKVKGSNSGSGNVTLQTPFTPSPAKIVSPDMLHTNGVLHVVDQVLVTQPTMAKYLQTQPSLTVLNAVVLQASKVANPLNLAMVGSTYTLFAPTDAAFQAYLGVSSAQDAITAVGARTPASMDSLLRYHLLPKFYRTPDFIANDALPTVLSKNVFVRRTGTRVRANQAQVTVGDYTVANGIVHQVDAVLSYPIPTVLGFIQASAAATSPTLTVLNTAISVTSFGNLLSTNAPITFFCPSDQAFIDYLNSIKDPTAGTITTASQAIDILNAYTFDQTNNVLLPLLRGLFLSSTAIFKIDLQDGTPIATANQQQTLTPAVANNSVTIVGSPGTPVATVVRADVLGTNGVAHVIDKVVFFN